MTSPTPQNNVTELIVDAPYPVDRQRWSRRALRWLPKFRILWMATSVELPPCSRSHPFTISERYSPAVPYQLGSFRPAIANSVTFNDLVFAPAQCSWAALPSLTELESLRIRWSALPRTILFVGDSHTRVSR